MMDKDQVLNYRRIPKIEMGLCFSSKHSLNEMMDKEPVFDYRPPIAKIEVELCFPSKHSLNKMMDKEPVFNYLSRIAKIEIELCFSSRRMPAIWLKYICTLIAASL